MRSFDPVRVEPRLFVLTTNSVSSFSLVEQFEHQRLGEAFHPCAPIDPISYAIAHEMVYGENRADFGYSDGDSDGENGY